MRKRHPYIPGRYQDGDSHRLSADPPPETLLIGLGQQYVFQLVLRNRDHVARSLKESANLASRKFDWSSHFPCELCRVLFLLPLEQV